MPTLYHHPMSSASRFIRLVLGEYGFEYDLVEEQPWEGRREFLALNPAGTLPVFLDDSMRSLCGAVVISEYLDETHGALKRDRRLLAENSFQRAEIRRLVEWFLVKMEQDVTRHLARERVFKLQMPTAQGGGAPDSKLMRAARGNIRQHMKYLTWLAGSRPWLAGDRLSYGDLAAAASISVLDYLGEIDWSEFPQSKDWYQRIKSRPSFRPLLGDRIRGVTPASHYADLDF
ncbi:glutathione S-transferase family protein [Georhizobium profundi]|jgi:glutathione S-transferase|uniref:Glutathione S-transferase family protein n=1 Tax=Georhizobium profundi TaxID=2341112 RepID=A0A3Q8XL28_9HYPH|nr:glutathione S-transferase family protein [Georhizobium profundi]AZN70088.1 glutathione S-transferase family protein [Georhizobium profundi]GLQ39887.1 glutathione S-transferase [Rhizobium albus]